MKSKVYKKCKFFNTGFCKNRENCRFQHPVNLCEENLETGKCSNFKTCKLRNPRECRYFNSDRSCFHGESCTYLHKEKCPLNENSANEETESNTAKLVTIEVNGKKFTVEKIEELDDETTNAMTADDFLKFCDDFQFEKTSEANEEVFVDLDHIEEELRNSIYLNATYDEIMNPKAENLRKATRKKSSSVKK